MNTHLRYGKKKNIGDVEKYIEDDGVGGREKKPKKRRCKEK
jgi:hypothetical protein